MKRTQHLLFLLAFTLLSGGIFAQVQSTLDIALRHIDENQKEWGLTTADIQDLKISDHVVSKVGNIDHYYFVQRHDGIDVHNAITSVHVNSKGKVTALGHNFIPDLASKVNTTSSEIEAADAVKSVFQNLEIPTANFNFNPKQRNADGFVFDKGNVSNMDIKVKPIYQVLQNGEVRLAYDVVLDPTENADYWSIRVDAVNAEIIDKANFTVYCSFANHSDEAHSASCSDHNHETPLVKTSTAKGESINAVMGGTYNVFAEMIDGNLFVHESPVHGDRHVLVEPADLEASPFGWHDVDGVDGADFTITRGNNVHSYLDTNDDNAPDAEADIDGGEELLFDFPWTDDLDPENSEGAAVTNLFFMTNYIHDFTYAYGFDESAGNFQQTNYTGEGVGDDYVRAEAQDGREAHYAAIADEDDTNDGVSVNNANFATPSDGVRPRMQMFVWNRTGGRLLNVLSPEGIQGKYTTATATYGPLPIDAPIATAELVLAFDDSNQDPTFCCNEIINDVAGKIAVIDRGGCFFQTKTQNAEDAGAIAVIVCNFEDATINMGAGDGAPFPTIPSVMMELSDCNAIRSVINSGQTVTASLGADGTVGADFFDGDVDNGIIAHEFAHGISNRLVGGPNNAGCLGNREQMGEGWSDFYTLVSTVKPGETGAQRSGIGTYVSRESSNGNGIRSNPYSTDMSIDPETFVDVTSVAFTLDDDGNVTDRPSVHALGAIWTSMLWDMYWDLVDEHGFDNDIVHGEGGNNIAVRLVTEGMKFTNCSPGFVDGRDGILAADEFLYDGANSCLIWKAFARRGLGENASQGSNENHQDGIADFNPPVGCVKEVKIAKRIVTTDRFGDVVEPGASVPMELAIRNDKDDPATEVVVTESIPAGANITDITGGGEVMGDNVVWDIGTLGVSEEMILNYTINVDPSRESTTLFIDDLEDGSGNWINISDSRTDPTQTENLFALVTADEAFGTNSGNAAYFIQDIALESRENLLLFEEIDVQGDNPGIRFFQNYDTETGSDGTLLQISFDGSLTWNELPEEAFIKNGYPRPIAFGTFVIPFLNAFTGNSDGWIDTWVDLSAYKGQVVVLRYRFGSDANNNGDLEAIGWSFDDFEFMDIVSYNTTATIATAEGDLVEAILPDGGIKINSSGIVNVATDDINNPSLEFNIYPNPASEMVNIAINNITAKDAQLSVYNYGGQLIEERNINLSAGSQLEEVNVRNYPTGFYFFRLTTERGVATEKVMVGK